MDSMQLSPFCLLLYQDDSLVCSYTDGTTLELSPCGSTFIHTQAAPPPDVHPLVNARKGTIRQRTVFVTSEHKTKVQYAIDIRNRFAARPYITSNLLHDTDYILETYADIKEVNWSPTLDEDYIEVLDNGGVRLRSLDECASLLISANEHDLSIEYLCKISDRVVNNRRGNLKDIQGHCGINHAGICESGATGVGGDSYATHDTAKPGFHRKTIQFAYVWMIQHLSVEHCPLEWQHPLQLAKKFKHRRINGKKRISSKNEPPLQEENTSIENCLASSASVVSDEDDNNEKERQMKLHFLENSYSANRNVPRTIIPAVVVDDTFENSVKMHLPDHLPTTCSNPHLHHWRNISNTQHLSENVDFDALVKTANCPLKMMVANGVVYRFFLDPVKSAEIYPGDGSVITLQDSRGQYFTHTVVNKDGSATEKMFTVNNQTMLSSNSPQAALIRMVNKAFRLLSVMPCSEKNSMEVCWKVLEPPVQIEKNQPAVIIGETTVPGLGYFTSFLDGRIRIVFADRTILNMEADDHRVVRYLSDAQLPDQSRNYAPNKTCEIILPNGRKRNVSTQNPTQECSRYVNLALEWAEWLHTYQKSPPGFSDECHEDGHRMVQMELEKLKCFNYMLDNSNVIGARMENGIKSSEVKTKDQTENCIGGIKSDFLSERQQCLPLRSAVDPTEVHTLLQKTSLVISSIDSLLLNK